MKEMDKLSHEIALLKFESLRIPTDCERGREIQVEILILQDLLKKDQWK